MDGEDKCMQTFSLEIWKESGRYKRRWEDNIIKMHHKVIGHENVEWMEQVQ
jgi:hypothetical protein